MEPNGHESFNKANVIVTVDDPDIDPYTLYFLISDEHVIQIKEHLEGT